MSSQRLKWPGLEGFQWVRLAPGGSDVLGPVAGPHWVRVAPAVRGEYWVRVAPACLGFRAPPWVRVAPALRGDRRDGRAVAGPCARPRFGSGRGRLRTRRSTRTGAGGRPRGWRRRGRGRSPRNARGRRPPPRSTRGRRPVRRAGGRSPGRGPRRLARAWGGDVRPRNSGRRGTRPGPSRGRSTRGFRGNRPRLRLRRAGPARVAARAGSTSRRVPTRPGGPTSGPGASRSRRRTPGVPRRSGPDRKRFACRGLRPEPPASDPRRRRPCGWPRRASRIRSGRSDRHAPRRRRRGPPAPSRPGRRGVTRRPRRRGARRSGGHPHPPRRCPGRSCRA